MNYLRSENKQKEKYEVKKNEKKNERQSIYTPPRIGSPPESGGVQLIIYG